MTSPIRPILGLFLLFSVSGGAIAHAQLNESADTTAPVAQADPQNAPQERSAPEIVSPRPRSTQELTLAQAAPIGDPDRPGADAAMTTVKVFQLDNQCEDFDGRVLKLPRDTALTDAVGQALETSDTIGFELAGYRVTEGPGFSEATVDFRLPAAEDEEETARTLKSLSLCEGLSLFGSIRRTLTANGQFGVDQVRFTLAGQDLR